jgi:hypothetical protein
VTGQFNNMERSQLWHYDRYKRKMTEPSFSRVWRGSDGNDYSLPPELAAFGMLSFVLGRVGEQTVTMSTLSKKPLEGYFEYGAASGGNGKKTGVVTYPAVQTHADIDESTRRRGTNDRLLRLSIGIEDVQDLIGDLEGVL